MDSSTSTSPQDVPTNSTSTGNPQEVQGSALQMPSQGAGLQNAGTLSVEALNRLDVGSTAIPLAANTTTATVTQTTAPKPVLSAKTAVLYGGITLLVAGFFVALIYGMFYKKH